MGTQRTVQQVLQSSWATVSVTPNYGMPMVIFLFIPILCNTMMVEQLLVGVLLPCAWGRVPGRPPKLTTYVSRFGLALNTGSRTRIVRRFALMRCPYVLSKPLWPSSFRWH
eukprot:4839472-Amphidinium_carterae.1